jgi:hypothetical protein
MRLRSRINPEEQRDLVEGPSRYRKGPDQFQMMCEVCGGTFFVDEVMFRQALTAMEEGSENSFRCDDCEGEYEELGH